MFATRATVHSTSRATPAQLVFGCDAMLNVQHEANWTYIKERRNNITSKNNKRENATCKKHEYNINNKVLLKIQTNNKYRTNPYSGPFKIVQVNNNKTVKLKKGCVTDTYNIRNIKPYYD
jgi:hypothetical protein